MNEISCEVCVDLMPLVQDGIASEDSCHAVKSHIRDCPRCRALFQGELPKLPDSELILKKFRKQLQLFGGLILLAGIFFGVSLSWGSGVFYNCLIMPVIGVVGYCLFRWRAVYFLPCVLFVLHLVLAFLGRIQGQLTLWGEVFSTAFFWSCIYSVFAGVGVLIAGLLHFALKKEQ